MRNFNRLISTVSLATAVGLGASACGGSNSPDKPGISNNPKPVNKANVLTIKTSAAELDFNSNNSVDIFQSGKDYASNADSNYYEQPIHLSCVGHRLYESTIEYNNSGGSTELKTDPYSDAFCADGMITPADFGLTDSGKLISLPAAPAPAK